MRLRYALSCLTVALMAGAAHAQINGDVIGVHDLGPGSKSPVTGARPDFCLYCHAPHSGIGGRTPITVCGRSFISNIWPTTRGSPPKRLRQ